ncbi:DUF6466 family protein [Bifidobacterium xylocopae]|uniref:Cell surface protein n=1 Tax=Bifidobacterium xylocopae TaxID=2493119 RepID=A0A366KGX6_9BIFI|nr:DUF6466 family protein [Bifidobacterium xylocopae]RBP99941.1 hypothetical protein CRD59_00250 [Bifidobacterium xylocopae]
MSGERIKATRQPGKAGLSTRLFLGALAVILLALGGLGLWNTQAVSSYNQASANLEQNLAEAAKPAADITKLKASQGQVDELFHQAQEGKALLLPATRRAIEHNAALSGDLTRALSRQDHLNKQGGRDRQGRSADSLNRKKAQERQGLDEEQRKKVEEMLKHNQDLQSPSPAPSSNPSGGSGGQSKPW